MTVASLYNDENLFRLIVEASPVGMIIADSEGRIVLANEQAQTLFGYAADELIGERIEVLVPEAAHGAHVSHRAGYVAHPRARPMGAGRNLAARRKDGSEVPVDISLHPIHTDAGMLVLANILDATPRKQAEQEREARQAIERLALLGQLAGSVAHDIRTPLCVIRNDLYFLQMLASELGPEGVECIEEINRSVGKADRIVSELLDFTRDSPSCPERIAVAEILQAALKDYPVPPEVTLIQPERLEAVFVEADGEQIERVLINLIRNGVEATDGKGRVEIRIVERGDLVWIEVADNGPGVPPAEQARIFEPLMTTKPRGIGLGLAIARRYAVHNNGQLTVGTEPGGGACFRLTLPKAAVKG